MSHRIAIVIDPWDHPFNGTVVSTRRFAGALGERGFGVRLLTIGPGGGETPERIDFPALRIPGVNRIIDAMRSPLARPLRRRVRAALQGCDLLHVQYPFFLGWVAVGEARRVGIPVVCSFHVQPENILSNLGLRSRWLNRMLYWLFRRGFYDRADRVIAPSEFAARLLREHGVIAPISVVSNGVPDGFFEVEHVSAAPPLTILSVGRLAQEKQQHQLLLALARSRHRGDTILRLVGAGPQQARLIEQARRLGIDATIGPVDDATLLALYRHADLFVHCGGVELEGMSVLEAMATANVVVVASSAASASGHLTDHPMSSFAAGSVDELAARIDHWLDDPVARAAEGDANRARVAGFRHQRCVSALVAVYQSLLPGIAAAGSEAADGSGMP